MSTLRDLTPYGYRVEQRLGQNIQGGRVTYLATSLETHEQVVIKLFSFSREDAQWAGLKAHEREIQTLQSIESPAVPRFLSVFELDDGFGLVQEYIDAPSLHQTRTFSPETVEHIARSILEVLVVLQRQRPLIIHRDIKPQNILMSSKRQVYLIDFGLARHESGDGVSTMVAGTPGFMAPEQFFAGQMTASTDLYGLGATLFALSMGISEQDIKEYVSTAFVVKWSALAGRSPEWFITWAERLTQPESTDRYEDAAEALVALDEAKQAAISSTQLVKRQPNAAELSVTSSPRRQTSSSPESMSIRAKLIVLLGAVLLMSTVAYFGFRHVVLTAPKASWPEPLQFVYTQALASRVHGGTLFRCVKGEVIEWNGEDPELLASIHGVYVDEGCLLKISNVEMKILSVEGGEVQSSNVNVTSVVLLKQGSLLLNASRAKSFNQTGGALRLHNSTLMSGLTINGGVAVVKKTHVKQGLYIAKAAREVSLTDSSVESVFVQSGKNELIRTKVRQRAHVTNATLNLYSMSVSGINADKSAKLNLKQVKFESLYCNSCTVLGQGVELTKVSDKPNPNLSLRGTHGASIRLGEFNVLTPAALRVSADSLLSIDRGVLALEYARIEGIVILRNVNTSGKAFIEGPLVYNASDGEVLGDVEQKMRSKSKAHQGVLLSKKVQKDAQKKNIELAKNKAMKLIEACILPSTVVGEVFPEVAFSKDGRATLTRIESTIAPCVRKSLKSKRFSDNVYGKMKAHLIIKRQGGAVQVKRQYVRFWPKR